MEPDIDADKYVAAVINKDRVGGHSIKEKKKTRRREWNIRILIESDIFWFYSKCPSNFGYHNHHQVIGPKKYIQKPIFFYLRVDISNSTKVTINGKAVNKGKGVVQ